LKIAGVNILGKKKAEATPKEEEGGSSSKLMSKLTTKIQ